MTKHLTIVGIMAGLVAVLSLFAAFLCSTHAAGTPTKGVEIPPSGLGCWVQSSSLDNPLIYSDAFSWYVTDISNMKRFENRRNKPLFISYADRDVQWFMKRMEDYRDKIVGAVWDKEQKEPQEAAERDLKRVYAKAKELGLAFAVVTAPGPDQALQKMGVSYANAKEFCDFLMPMMYVQWFGMRRAPLETFLSKERGQTRIPIVAVLTPEAFASPHPGKLTPQEIVSTYKGLAVDGFCVWNVKSLDEGLLRALREITK